MTALPTNVSIKVLEADDFTEFLRLQRVAIETAPEVFGSDYDFFDSLSVLSKEQKYERYQAYPYAYLLGAANPDGRLIGMIGFSCDYTHSKVRHKSQLWGLYIHEEYRRRGIATLLTETIISIARDAAGCELIQLSVSTANPESYELYLRLGFIVYGTEIHAIKLPESYVDEYLMVKFLR